jgi:hypothetical protein
MPVSIANAVRTTSTDDWRKKGEYNNLQEKSL